MIKTYVIFTLIKRSVIFCKSSI